MKCPPKIDEQALRSLIKAEGDGPLVENPWPCDVMNIHADLIDLHNQDGVRRGFPIEASFSQISRRPKTVEELLWADFDYLAVGSSDLRASADHYVFAEIAAPKPDASQWEIDTGSWPLHLICFKSPLFYLVNSALSKIFVLNHDERKADCLPEHESLFEGDTYSDTNLLAGLFNDTEVLFDKKRLSVPFEPPHMAFPYDYCQQVEGARRFILAHELGHTLFNNKRRPAHIAKLIPADLTRTPEHKSWQEEYWCDAFAISTILSIYDGQLLDNSRRYELENTLVGILTFFTLMDLVDAVIGKHLDLSNSHPPARFRREVIRNIVKGNSLYEQTENLKTVLMAKWRRLNAFRQFAGGANAPIFFRLNSLWSYPDFIERLTPFGESSYRALFEATVKEMRIFYNDDMKRRRMDEGYF